MFNFHIIKTKTSAAIPSHSQRVYLLVLLLDLLALAANQLAVRSSAFADAYSHYVYRVLSLGIGSVMGLLPFSVVELLLYATILFVLFDFAKQLCRALRVGAACVHSARISQDAQTHLLAAVARPLRRFLGHLFLILSTLLVLYVFLCGINYHRTSFSEEAGLSVTIDAHGTVYDEADLIALCDYLVTEINDTDRFFNLDIQIGLCSIVHIIHVYKGFFIELFPGAKAGHLDLNIHPRLIAVKADELFGQVHDPHRLAHIQHIDTARGGHAARLQHQPGRFLDGHKIPHNIRMSYRYRTTSLNLLLKQWNNASVAS